MNILKNVLLLLLENNIVCIIQIQATVSSKQGSVFIKNLLNWYLIKSIFRITYRTGYDWYNRIGNGIRDPNGTDLVYVFVGETATCVKKSQGVHNKCLKKHNFNFKLWLCALIFIQRTLCFENVDFFKLFFSYFQSINHTLIYNMHIRISICYQIRNK